MPTPLGEANAEDRLLDGEQWTVRIREVRSIQNLNACLVVAIKWRHCAGTIRCDCGVRICEPNSHVVDLDRRCRRIGGGVVAKNLWSWGDTGCLDKSLFAENTSEISNTPAIGIRANVTLIPRQSERTVWNLKEEYRELSVRR
jgi:hypothetical protein